MKSADLTGVQRLELAAWIQSGSRQYADLCGYGKGEIQTNIRIQIDKYAEEFGRILRGEVEMSEEDDPLTLRTDLYGLKKSGCPASGLVELMLASTSDFGVTISDLLFRAKILDEQLISHKNLGFPTELKKPGCPASRLAEAMLESDSVAKMFRRLFQAGILDDDFCSHENRGCPAEPRRAIKRGVPLSIQFMLQEKMGLPYPDETRSYKAGRTLALFYLLLKHFGYGHPTLTQMLRTMQYIRRRVAPVADYLQTTGRDTFNVSAVQRRVCRFFKADPASKGHLQQEILQYLSKHHQRSLLGGQIWTDQDLRKPVPQWPPVRPLLLLESRVAGEPTYFWMYAPRIPGTVNSTSEKSVRVL